MNERDGEGERQRGRQRGGDRAFANVYGTKGGASTYCRENMPPETDCVTDKELRIEHTFGTKLAPANWCGPGNTQTHDAKEEGKDIPAMNLSNMSTETPQNRIRSLSHLQLELPRPVIQVSSKHVGWAKYNFVYPTYSPYAYNRRPKDVVYTEEDKEYIFKELDALREELFPGQILSCIMPCVFTVPKSPKQVLYQKIGESMTQLKDGIKWLSVSIGGDRSHSGKQARPSVILRNCPQRISTETLSDDPSMLSDCGEDPLPAGAMKVKKVPMSGHSIHHMVRYISWSPKVARHDSNHQKSPLPKTRPRRSMFGKKKPVKVVCPDIVVTCPSEAV